MAQLRSFTIYPAGWHLSLEARAFSARTCASACSAMSEALAEMGALVAVVDIDASGVHRVVESLERRGLRGPAVVGDTMVENALRLLIDTVADEHGRLDILVN